MQVRFKCGSCSTSVQVDSSHAGKKAKCPKCGTVLQIPTMDKIAAAQARQSGAAAPTPASPAAATAASVQTPPSAAADQGLTDFAPQFDADDFDFEAPAPAPSAAPGPLAPAPSYYYQPNEAEYAGPVTYAGFWKRFAAFFLDQLIVGVGTAGLGFAIGVAGAVAGVDETAIAVFAQLIGVVAGLLYYTMMESSEYQATLGKQALGVKVTDLEGHRISFGRATGRYFAKLLNVITLGVGYIMIAFTEKKQGLHDIVAGTLVVNR
jgi:uncharacterized RDD family membrane protein YckC